MPISSACSCSPDRDWLGFVQYVSERSMPSWEDDRVFDGSRFRLANHDQQIWPTFIYRYASRRENFGTVAAVAPPAAAPAGGSIAPRPFAPSGRGGM